MIQLRESREKTGPLIESRDRCSREPLMPCIGGSQELTLKNAIGGMSNSCELPNPRARYIQNCTKKVLMTQITMMV